MQTEPMMLKIHLALGSRSGSEAPLSISTGFERLMDTMFFIRTAAKKARNKIDVTLIDIMETSKSRGVPIPITLPIIISVSLLKSTPTPMPEPIDTADVIKLSANRTRPRCTFSIPSIL